MTWLATLLLLAMSAAVLIVYGAGEDGVRTWVRATARSSGVLFLTIFTARPLHQLLRSNTTRWLMKSRRYVGVSAAISHLIHLCGIVWLSVGWPAAYVPDLVTLILGGLGFVLFFAMGLTSSDAAVRALGKYWKRLHKVGAWYVWLIFAFTFVPDPEMGWDVLHAGFVLSFLSAGLLRAVVAAGRLRSSRAA